MLPYDKKTLDAMAGPARDMFEQWISFFPTAPLFGVKWRFAPDGADLQAGLKKMFSPEAMMGALAPRMPADRPVVKAEVPTPVAKPAPAEARVQAAPVAEAPAKPVATADAKPAEDVAKPAVAKPAVSKANAATAAPTAKSANAPENAAADKLSGTKPTTATSKPAAKKAAAAKAQAPVETKIEGGPVDKIKGIGPRLAAELGAMGITSVGQIAALSRSDMAKIDAELTTIKGRCFRDDWIGQAKALMAG